MRAPFRPSVIVFFLFECRRHDATPLPSGVMILIRHVVFVLMGGFCPRETLSVNLRREQKDSVLLSHIHLSANKNTVSFVERLKGLSSNRMLPMRPSGNILE